VHDELFARALVLFRGQHRAAIVCLDLVGLDCGLAADLGAEIRRQTGIGTVLLSCTHTHSAPFTIPWSVLGSQWLSGEGRGWRSQLVVKTVSIVRRAVANRVRAVLRAGRMPLQIGFNRRLPTPEGVRMAPNREGPVAPWVDVLRVDDTRGMPVAVLFSHAAHPVIVHRASTLISADYPGAAVADVRRRLGPQTVAMFAQGCGANINAEPLAGGFAAAERAGIEMAEAVVRAAEASEPINGKWAVSEITVALPFQDPPPLAECERACRAAEERLAREEEKCGTNQQAGLWGLQDAVLCLRDLRDRVRRDDRSTLPFTAEALAVEDAWCLVAMTHEVFAEYQIWIDRIAPFRRTMVMAYTNGCESYLPTDDALAQGGYEAGAFPTAGCASLRYRYRLGLQPGIEHKVKSAVHRLLDESRSGEPGAANART
jgi:hypothetical protein